MTKTILSVFVLSSFSLLLAACGKTTTNQMTPPTPANLTTVTPSSPSASPLKTTDTLVGIKTKDGQIVVKLYSDATPNTVATFLKKVQSGFYNGLTFHRVIDGFMAQGGDPTGTGMGGGQQKSELNNLPFKRGSLGLARTPQTKEVSNDSQFFICFTTEGCSHLTGDYVNFGEVVSGLDILDLIKQGDKILEITTKTK